MEGTLRASIFFTSPYNYWPNDNRDGIPETPNKIVYIINIALFNRLCRNEINSFFFFFLFYIIFLYNIFYRLLSFDRIWRIQCSPFRVSLKYGLGSCECIYKLLSTRRRGYRAGDAQFNDSLQMPRESRVIIVSRSEKAICENRNRLRPGSDRSRADVARQ